MKIQTKTQYILPGEQVAAVPLGNFDVFEDESTLVNRLYYAVPTFEEGVFHCDFYYEEKHLPQRLKRGFDAGSYRV